MVQKWQVTSEPLSEATCINKTLSFKEKGHTKGTESEVRREEKRMRFKY